MAEPNIDSTAPSQPEARSTTANDLASLLSEFEAGTAKPAVAPSSAAESPNSAAPNGKSNSTEAPVDPVAAAIEKAMNQGKVTDELTAHLSTYGRLVEQMRVNEIQRQAKADFENIVSKGNEMLKDAGVPVGDDFVKRWLIAESSLDPQLREAFDSAYLSKDHLRRAEKLIGKAMNRLLTSAKSQPDPEATADKRAVAWAVKNSGRAIPAPAAPKYGDMNDADFAAEKKKLGL